MNFTKLFSSFSKLLLNGTSYKVGNGGMIFVPDQSSFVQAAAAEAIATFLLIYIILHVAVEQTDCTLGPIAVGFTVIANIFAL